MGESIQVRSEKVFAKRKESRGNTLSLIPLNRMESLKGSIEPENKNSEIASRYRQEVLE